MPNHVFNIVNMNDIANHRNLFQKEDEETLDFNAIKPMPESLDVPSNSLMEDSIYYYLLNLITVLNETNFKFLPKLYIDQKVDERSILDRKISDRSIEEIISQYNKIPDDYKIDGKDLTYERFLELGKIAADNIYNYGAMDWYQWSLDNWGTKWNAYDGSMINEDTITFNSAWDPPIPVLKELSALYPYDEISLEFMSEDIGYAGSAHFLDGDMIELEQYPMYSDKHRQLFNEAYGYDYMDEEGCNYPPAFIDKAFGVIEEKGE